MPMPRTTVSARNAGAAARPAVTAGPRGPSSAGVRAELVGLHEILPRTWLTTWHAPAIATAARAGQYVHVRTIEAGGLPLRRPSPIVATETPEGTLTLQVSGASPAGHWLRMLRTGDRVELLGPFGRMFEVDPRSRHLLLVTEEAAIAGVRLLAQEAIRDGRSVVLLFGARSAARVHPSSLLPDEVEYVVATADGSLGQRGSVEGLVTDYEAWADQAFAAGSTAMLGAVARLAAGRRARLGVATLGRKRGGGRAPAPGAPEARRRAWLQVVLPQAIGCAGGTCLGCAVMGASGAPQRVCREGPVFAADELAWPAEPAPRDRAGGGWSP
jgi:dihydroorotate dehydrogenase electron transfer subunit